jgi:peptidoglycan hydrolase-like protein with peptidoglycan-binding domain
MRGLRIAAVFVSLLLGALSGLAVAALSPGSGAHGARDPLNLGIPLVNPTCDGRSIVILGRGDNRASLRSAIVNAADRGQASYLDAAASCPTAYTYPELRPARYVVYLGPYPDAGAACRVRMTPEHDRDSVARLHPGNEMFVKCACELPVASMPTLSSGMQADTVDTRWVKVLQSMLVDLHRLRADVDQTGVYDQRTARVVRQIQGVGGAPVTGVVDPDTWALVVNRACKLYDY